MRHGHLLRWWLHEQHDERRRYVPERLWNEDVQRDVQQQPRIDSRELDAQLELHLLLLPPPLVFVT